MVPPSADHSLFITPSEKAHVLVKISPPWSAALLCSAALLTASCSSALSSTVIDPNEATTGGVIAAAYITPQFHAIDDSSTGYVILINETGEIQTIETGGIAYGTLAWSDQGLFFSDLENDYLLTNNGTHTIDSPKTDYQHTTFATGRGFVSLYNYGFVDDGYIEEGLDSNGTHAFTALMLTQLSGDDIDSEKLVSIREVSDSDQYTYAAACEDGVLRHLATRWDGPEGQPVPMLRSWDITTGDVNEVDLHTPKGEPLGATDFGFETVGNAPFVAGDDGYQWVSTYDHALMSTDVATGEATVVTELDGTYDPGLTTLMADFTETHLFTLSFTIDNEAMTLRSYDRYTGAQGITIDITQPADLLSQEQVLRGFAASHD